MIYFTANTFKCVCHCRRAMFRVLGMYNFARGTDYAHLITTGTPRFSDLPTALHFHSEWHRIKNIIDQCFQYTSLKYKDKSILIILAYLDGFMKWCIGNFSSHHSVNSFL